MKYQKMKCNKILIELDSEEKAAWFKCSEHFVFKKQPKTLDGYDYSHFLKCEVFTKNSTF